MLAATGGPDIHPHAASNHKDRARWDRDMANVTADLKLVEKFFLDVLDGHLSDTQRDSVGMSFFGVGWQMVVVIEKTMGRDALIASMCDQRKLLSTYNRAATLYNNTSLQPLALWSSSLLERLQP